MLGAITGDVVGSAYEFHNTKDYKFEMFPKGASFTDDSVMTLAVAQWLMKDGDRTQQGLEDCLVRFAQENPSPKGDYGGGCSGTGSSIRRSSPSTAICR